MPRASAARGFTLIEVIVALTIGSAVVLMVHQAFGAMIDVSGRLDTERAQHGRRMHTAEALEPAFGSLEIGFAGTTGFEGQPNRVAFSATLPTGTRPAPVAIAIEGGWLMLRRGTAPVDTLAPATAVALDYLLSYGAQATWVQSWHSPASAPLAVRLRLLHNDAPADTLLFVIGPRG
jgi:prepilin-type N-terminal cleavage/methylation domain-containing protein